MFAPGGFARIRTTASATAAAALASITDLLGRPRTTVLDWLAASFIASRPDRQNGSMPLPRPALQHGSVRSLEIVHQIDLAEAGRGPAEHDQRCLGDGRSLWIEHL